MEDGFFFQICFIGYITVTELTGYTICQLTYPLYRMTSCLMFAVLFSLLIVDVLKLEVRSYGK